MQHLNLTAEQRIERQHIQLMQSKRFCLFSGVFMVGKVDVSDKCKTASTNGRDVTYGREFVNQLTDKQLAFLIVHEAMHKAYRHMTVWSKIANENRKLANMAMDYVINLQIRDADPYEEEVAMPRDENGKLMGLLDDRFKGMDTMQVYNLLKKESDKGSGGGRNGNPSGQDDSDSACPSDGAGEQEDGSSGDEGQSLDDHDWDGAQDMSEEEEEELQREIDSALREGAMLAGRMNGNVSRQIDELLHPKVDWKEALRDFVKLAMKGNDQSTWRRTNRRYLGVDIVMPSADSRKAEMFVLAIDTSGSIGHAELAQFLGEVKSICEEVVPETIELLYWDGAVASRETYRGAEVATIVESTKPSGGGGTAPDCVPMFIREKHMQPQCVIMLTDGYFYGHDPAAWSNLTAPVLWCVKGNNQFRATVGQAVHVE